MNRSGVACAVEAGGRAVRIGLGYVKGVGTRAEGLVAERAAEGPYSNLGELVRRAPLASDQLEGLIRAGACDGFDPNRRRLLWELPLHRAPRSRATASSWRSRSTPPPPRPCRACPTGSGWWPTTRP